MDRKRRSIDNASTTYLLFVHRSKFANTRRGKGLRDVGTSDHIERAMGDGGLHKSRIRKEHISY